MKETKPKTKICPRCGADLRFKVIGADAYYAHYVTITDTTNLADAVTSPHCGYSELVGK